MTVRYQLLGVLLAVAAVGAGCSSGRSASAPVAPLAPAVATDEPAAAEEPTAEGAEQSFVVASPQPEAASGPLDLLQEGLDAASGLLTGEELDLFGSPDDSAPAETADDGEPPQADPERSAEDPLVAPEAPPEEPEVAQEESEPPEESEVPEEPEAPPEDPEVPAESGAAAESSGPVEGVPRRIERAGDPLTPTAELAELAGDPEAEVRHAVARNPAAPSPLLAALLADGDPGVRWGAAANPSLWPEFRELPLRPMTLAEFLELFPYRPRIPADPETDQPTNAEVIAELRAAAQEAVNQDDEEEWNTERILAYVLESFRRAAPPPELTSQEYFEWWLDRSEAPSLPADLPLSRRAIAENPAPWPAVVPLLVADYRARQWAAADLRTPPDQLLALAADPRGNASVWVGANPSAPPEALAWLAGRADDPMRRAVSENPAAPPSILATLAGDDVVGVRRGVARHPSTPAATLAGLAEDADVHVRRATAANAAAPAAALELLARDDDALIRLAAAGNPATPPEALADLLDDGDRWVRWAAANNPSLPLDALDSVAGDAGVIGRRNEPIDPPPPDPPGAAEGQDAPAEETAEATEEAAEATDGAGEADDGAGESDEQ